jgi:hypothetical protein
MALPQKDAILTGLAVAAVVAGIHAFAVPNNASVRGAQQANAAITHAGVGADGVAIAVVIGVSLLAHDSTVFVIGGVVVIALSAMTQIANATNPVTGSIPVGTSTTPQPGA